MRKPAAVGPRPKDCGGSMWPRRRGFGPAPGLPVGADACLPTGERPPPGRCSYRFRRSPPAGHIHLAAARGPVHDEAHRRPDALELVERREVRPQHDLALVEIQSLPFIGSSPCDPRSDTRLPPFQPVSTASTLDRMEFGAEPRRRGLLLPDHHRAGEWQPREIEIWFGLVLPQTWARARLLHAVRAAATARTGSGTCCVSPR